MKTGTFFTFLFVLLFSITASADPPYDVAYDLGPDIITEDDPTTFVESVYIGEVIPDSNEPSYLFNTTYSDGLSIEFTVEQKLGDITASSTHVNFYAPVIGQMPYSLRKGFTEIRIKADEGEVMRAAFGRIYVYPNGLFISRTHLEEVFLHEAAHASLDAEHRDGEGWQNAKAEDNDHISEHASKFPVEDLAESFLAFTAYDSRSDRISDTDVGIIGSTIPNRIAYLRSLNLNMEPLAEFDFQINPGLNDAWYNPATNGQGFLISVFPDIKQLFLAWFTYDTERPLNGMSANLGEPGHRWLTAQGPYDGDTANLTIYVTEGGVFDASEPPAVLDPAGDGTMTIEFADCTGGLVSYEIASLGISSVIPIQRIVPDNIPLCEKLSVQ